MSGATTGLRYCADDQSQLLGIDPHRPLSRMPLRHGLGRDPHRRVEPGLQGLLVGRG